MSLLFRFYPYIAGVLFAMAIAGWIWMRGYHACQAAYDSEYKKVERENVVIEQKNMRLSSPDIDKHLCAKWMRSPCPKRHL